MDERETRTLEIHKAALSGLRNPTKKLATRRLFLELKEQKNAPPSKEWLEAAALSASCVWRGHAMPSDF